MSGPDLQFNFQDTLLNRCIQKLYSELSAKKIQYRPRYYFTCGGDEWGCTDRVPIIGIPFHLADNRLTRIEREMGYTSYDKPDLIPLLRHEAGHAINYAYELYRTAEWEEIFGNFERIYPANFRFKFNPYSRNYVRSQGEPKYHAQAHPDEDFAETFAVWLTPRSNWRAHYENWPALRKIEYIDRTMRRLRNRKPQIHAGPLDSAYHTRSYKLIVNYGENIDDFKDNALGSFHHQVRLPHLIQTAG